MQLIETKTLVSAQSSISFTEIPQTFDDLLVLYSFRSTRSSTFDYDAIQVNSVSPSIRFLAGDGASAFSGTNNASTNSGANATANTFGNTALYLPNYKSAVNKSGSIDSVQEHNGTDGYQFITALLFATTSPITTISFTPVTGPNYVAGSTVSLYGITKGSDGIVTTS